MRVIITGAGGLLGHRLAAAAERAGFETIGIGRSPQPPAGLACHRWIAGDLADQRLREHDWSALAGAPVFHLAGDTQVYQPGRDFSRGNLATTGTACAIARQTGGRLVLFSSSAVYSGPRTRRPVVSLREGDETQPTGDYGRSKIAAEDLVRQSGVDAVVLRLFGVLSDRLASLPDRGNLVQAIVRAGRTGRPVAVATGEGGEPMVRDYVLDEDVCQCALAALSWARPAGGPLTVNVCTGKGTSVEAMVQLAAEAGGLALASMRVPGPATVNPVMVGDPTLLRKLLGRVPANRLEEFWTRFWPGLAPVPGSS